MYWIIKAFRDIIDPRTHTTLEEVHSLCDELIKSYNQSSVLIQANETKTEFYSG